MASLLHDYTDRWNMMADSSAGVFGWGEGALFAVAWGRAFQEVLDTEAGPDAAGDRAAVAARWTDENTDEHGVEWFDSEEEAVDYADDVAESQQV